MDRSLEKAITNFTVAVVLTVVGFFSIGMAGNLKFESVKYSDTDATVLELNTNENGDYVATLNYRVNDTEYTVYENSNNLVEGETIKIYYVKENPSQYVMKLPVEFENIITKIIAWLLTILGVSWSLFAGKVLFGKIKELKVIEKENVNEENSDNRFNGMF